MKGKFIMKANMINTNSVIKNICAVVLLLGMSVSAWGLTIELPTSTNIFSLSTSGNGASSETSKTYGGYTYKLYAANNCYYYNSEALFIGKSGSYITFPAIANKKLASVTIWNNSGAGAPSILICPTDNTTATTGGTAATVSAGSSNKWTLTATSANTAYRMYINNDKNLQATRIQLVYSNTAAYKVTFDAEGGSCETGSSTEGSANAGVELPEAIPSASMASMGWGFYGWAESVISSPTTTAPTIVGKAGDTYYPDAAITLHAVYAKGTYTKVTSTSEIESGAKYLIAGDDHNNKKFYIMGDYYFLDTYYYMEGHEFGSGNDRIEDTYHAADIYSTWRYIITGTAGNYVIKDNSDTKYVDVYATNWLTASSSRKNTITFGDGGYCTIANNSGGYLVVFIGGNFGDNGSAWDKMLLYKETETPTYCSNPITIKLEASPAAGGSVEFTDDHSLEKIFGYGDDYTGNVKATVNSGYEFIKWRSSDQGSAEFTEAHTQESTKTTDEIYAIDNATITAYFYLQHSVTYDLTGVTKESGITTVDYANKDGFEAEFALAAHYKALTLSSVTMGGDALTEDEDYLWDAATNTLSIATTITGDIVITVSATHMEYTKYAFSCAELTLTPKLVTAGTPIFITSAASKKVRSQDSILIVGSGLTPSASLTFPSLAGTKFEVKSRLGGDFTIKADGTIDTVAYIYYTPAAEDTDDGLDKLTGFTASVGGAKPITVTLTQSIIGRHLPNKIVIAAKGSDNKWYALPSYMQNASSYNVSPQEISVDNVTLPTKAYSSSTNRYNGIEGPTATNISNNRGQYVRLLMDIHVDSLDSSTPYAPLFGQSGDGTKIGRSGKANPTNNLSEGWWWLLTQTNTSVTNPQDAKYNIKCANNAKLLRLWEAAGGVGNPKWGLYANGISELRLIPMEDGVEFAEAYMIEWGQHGAIVEVDAGGIFATKVSATIGDGDESAKIALSQTLTSVSSYSTKYNYTVNFGDGIDFAADESNGAQLTLKWYDSYDDLKGVSNIIIPKIIASTNATMSTIESRKTQWQTWEVHVLPGDTLFADAGSFASSGVTIKDLQIYPGATVKVTSGTLDVTNLSLRNGWTRVGSKRYDAARLQIKSSANLTHTNAYVDLYIDNDQFYPLAVPFPVSVEDISYVYSKRSFTVGGTTGEVRLRYYDGASRAAGKSGNWKYYGAAGALDVPTTLLPSVGYAIAVKRPSGKAFSVLRLPLTFGNVWTTGGEKGHYTDESVPPVTHYKDTVRVFAYGKNAEIQECNKGWNLIGNPYMAVFHGDNSEDGIYGKILAVTNKDNEKADKVRYITIPNSSFTDYTQVNFKDGSLNPGSSFLIQAKDTCQLVFSNAKIDVPSAPARYTATPTAASEQEVYIRLSNENSNDVMGLVIGEDYTAAYETNADLMKMLGELNTLKTYMIYDSVEMAYLAINEELAQEWIPVTVRIPSTGEYTYSMTGMSEIEDLEGVYLIDYTNNVVTNLIENNYSFMATEGTIAGRFAINAIVGKHDTPTDIDIIHAGGDIKSNQPFKFIYNDKVFILHNGIIYDSTGKKVREINK